MRITHLEKEEFEEMMIFLEKSYGVSHYFFPQLFPHVWRSDTIPYKNIIIAKEEDKIVSHVGIFPLMGAVGDAEIKMGGIGGVATLPEFRGKGYMSKLMDYSIQKMAEDKYPISILRGDRQRYGNFDYEVAGTVMIFELTQRSLKRTVELSSINITRLEEKKEVLERVSFIHKNEPLRIKRGERDYTLIFTKPNLITLLGERGGKFAYLSFYNHARPSKGLVECGGNAAVLLPLIFAFLKRWEVKSVEVPFPYFPTSTFFALLKASSNWHTQALGMIKILSLPQTIKSYSPVIEKKAQRLGLKGELTLEIEEKKEKITLCLDPELTLKKKDSREKITLSEREMVRLLFSSPYLVNVKHPSSLLYSLFPLPLYVGSLDPI